MSSTIDTDEHQADVGAVSPDERRLPFGVLLAVELRKMVDTRAPLAFLIVLFAVVVAALVIVTLVTGGLLPPAFATNLEVALWPIGFLLPVLAITATTSEWTQRSALVTFALEPRRTRVGLAKIAAVLIVALAFVLVAAAAAAVTTAAGGPEAIWDIDGRAVAGLLAAVLVPVLSAAGLGLLLGSRVLALAVHFLLPQLVALVAFWPKVAHLQPWIDRRMAEGILRVSEVTGEMWGQAATSFGLWVVLPLVFGVVMVSRRHP